MQVREIMTTPATRVTPDTPVRDVASVMRDDHLGALPVCDGDRVIGMVTDRDIAVRAIPFDHPLDALPVREVMSEDACCVHQDDPVEEAARQMADHQVRRIPVLDADDFLVGMISLADIARKCSDKKPAEDAIEGIVEPSDEPRRM